MRLLELQVDEVGPDSGWLPNLQSISAGRDVGSSCSVFTAAHYVAAATTWPPTVFNSTNVAAT